MDDFCNFIFEIFLQMPLLERQELSISLFYKDSCKIYTKVAEKDSQTYIFRSKLGVCADSEPKFFILHRELSSREQSRKLVILYEL